MDNWTAEEGFPFLYAAAPGLSSGGRDSAGRFAYPLEGMMTDFPEVPGVCGRLSSIASAVCRAVTRVLPSER